MCLEHSNAAPHSVQQTESYYGKLKVNPTHGADLVQRTVNFVSERQQLGGHQLYSKKNAGT